jgi:hypothetical protein
MFVKTESDIIRDMTLETFSQSSEEELIGRLRA